MSLESIINDQWDALSVHVSSPSSGSPTSRFQSPSPHPPYSLFFSLSITFYFYLFLLSFFVSLSTFYFLRFFRPITSLSFSPVLYPCLRLFLFPSLFLTFFSLYIFSRPLRFYIFCSPLFLFLSLSFSFYTFISLFLSFYLPLPLSVVFALHHFRLISNSH